MWDARVMAPSELGEASPPPTAPPPLGLGHWRTPLKCLAAGGSQLVVPHLTAHPGLQGWGPATCTLKTRFRWRCFLPAAVLRGTPVAAHRFPAPAPAQDPTGEGLASLCLNQISER